MPRHECTKHLAKFYLFKKFFKSMLPYFKT
jgi:hypothetical protein